MKPLFSELHPLLRYFPGFLLVMILLPDAAYSQEGRFIGAWGGPQYVAIHNTDDYIGRDVSTTSTLGWGGGLSYLNQEGRVGFRSGLLYSIQGQAYHGEYSFIDDEEDEIESDYESELTLEYIKLPLLFNFRSEYEGEGTVNLNMYAGLQLSFLTSASMETTPPYTEAASTPNMRDLFNTLDYSFVTGANFNYWFTEDWAFMFGVRFDRTLGNMENHSYEFSDEYPLEYYFPVSTKKSSRPDQRDMENRDPSKNLAITLQLGLQFRISEH